MSALADLRAELAATPGAGTAVFGAYTAPAIRDFDGQGWGPTDTAQVGVEIITMLYPFPDLPNLKPGDAIAFDGDPYLVSRGPRRKDDGLIGVVILEDA
nr:hypothetical protein [uncultured Holophaga sp.]